MRVSFCASLKRSVLVVLVVLAGSANAGWFGAEFSADVVQTSPQQGKTAGKMYVGENRVRNEITVQGQTQIQILDASEGKAWMIMPSRNQYMVMPMRRVVNKVSGEQTPCESLPVSKCQRQDEEVINGRGAVRWEIEGQLPSGAPLKGTVWTDRVHGFPIREVYNGEVASELSYTGDEKVQGRMTERWEASGVTPDGNSVKTTQWYDPALNIAIRQEMPGGVIRELQNIQLGEQNDSLFEVPQGYQQVQPNFNGAGQ